MQILLTEATVDPNPFLDTFLDPADSTRVQRTLRRLAAHGVSGWALTGGLAIEIHLLARGAQPVARPLHDVDFLAASFNDIPRSLGRHFALRHVHPHDPPGKIIFQAVDPETALRIDLFRAYGAEMERLVPVDLHGLTLQMVSLQDLVARHARLNWDLVEGRYLDPKYARDLERMLDQVSTHEVEEIWREHRPLNGPEDFGEALSRVREATTARPELLVPPTYSTNPQEICPRCAGSEELPLADPARILALLSYC